MIKPYVFDKYMSLFYGVMLRLFTAKFELIIEKVKYLNVIIK